MEKQICRTLKNIHSIVDRAFTPSTYFSMRPLPILSGNLLASLMQMEMPLAFLAALVMMRGNV